MLSDNGSGFEVTNGGQAYTLSHSDHTTISSIKTLLISKAYKELFTVDNHLLLLESIKRRLSIICAGETSTGLMNWDLKQHISDLRELMNNLRQIRREMLVSLN